MRNLKQTAAATNARAHTHTINTYYREACFVHCLHPKIEGLIIKALNYCRLLQGLPPRILYVYVCLARDLAPQSKGLDTGGGEGVYVNHVTLSSDITFF